MHNSFFSVIFLCVQQEDVRHFLIRACSLDMCNGEYLFIYTTVDAPKDNWSMGDEHDEIAKKAYANLIQVGGIFVCIRKKRASVESNNYNRTEQLNIPCSVYCYYYLNYVLAGFRNQDLPSVLMLTKW